MAIIAGKYCVDPLNISDGGSVWVAVPEGMIQTILTIIAIMTTNILLTRKKDFPASLTIIVTTYNAMKLQIGITSAKDDHKFAKV